MTTWATGEMTIQVGDLIVRKQALMLPTNDTGSVIIQKNAGKKKSPRSVIFLFSTNYFSTPPGYVKTKKVLHTLPEISPRKIARNKP